MTTCVNGCDAPFGIRCSVCNTDQRRTTSRPIPGERLTTGERARRAAVVAAVYPGLDPIDAFHIHEFMKGDTDTITQPGGELWDRLVAAVWPS
jgi:hypothetical protein